MHGFLRAILFGAVSVALAACGGSGGGSDTEPEPQPAPVATSGSCGEERDICRTGTYRNVLDSDTEYLWNCEGANGGETAMCSLRKPIYGRCGSERNQCLSGTYRNVLDSDTEYLWNCEGANGGETAMCSLRKPIYGRCGSERNQCLSGTLEEIRGNPEQYRWNCHGDAGSSPALCASPKPFDGQCDEEVNMCLRGNFEDVEDTDTDSLWKCNGTVVGQADAMCSLSKAVVCPNGAPAADNPFLCKRGHTMIAGIDRLPLDRVQLTNVETQQHFAIVDPLAWHARVVGITACDSYVTASEGCEHHENRAGVAWHPEGDVERRNGLIPFTQILHLYRGGEYEDREQWTYAEIAALRDLKILNVSSEPNHKYFGDADTPYLMLRSVGNGQSNISWSDRLAEYDYLMDLFTRSIAANKVLFVGGHDRNAHGDYIRDSQSSSCRDLDNGCLWAPYGFHPSVGYPGGGTSLSAPNVAASLASVLSVFPDTSHQDLAKLARACAKKRGEGIDGPTGLLATSGGFGVADFSCMDEITAASEGLSGNDTATLDIDGRNVVVGSRSIVVHEP